MPRTLLQLLLCRPLIAHGGAVGLRDRSSGSGLRRIFEEPRQFMSKAPSLPRGMPDEIVVTQLLLGGQQFQICQTKWMRPDFGPKGVPHSRIRRGQ